MYSLGIQKKKKDEDHLGHTEVVRGAQGPSETLIQWTFYAGVTTSYNSDATVRSYHFRCNFPHLNVLPMSSTAQLPVGSHGCTVCLP